VLVCKGTVSSLMYLYDYFHSTSTEQQPALVGRGQRRVRRDRIFRVKRAVCLFQHHDVVSIDAEHQAALSASSTPRF